MLFLYKDIFVALQDWEQLINILPSLIMDYKEKIELERMVFAKMLDIQLKNEYNKEEFMIFWEQEVPRYLKKEIKFKELWVSFLVKAGMLEQAEKYIYKTLKYEWSDKLAEVYSNVEGDNFSHKLKTVENWLQQYPNKGILYLILARLSFKGQLWGKARYYYEECVNKYPIPIAYLELGNLLEKLGDHELSMKYYKEGYKFI